MPNITLLDRLQFLGEKFTPAVAWIDLQILAEDGIVKTSFRSLSERWKWSTNKVIRFINDLVLHEDIELSRGTFHGTITEQIISIKSIGCRCDGTLTERSTEHKETPLDGPSPIPTLPFPPTPPITHTPVTTTPIIPKETVQKRSASARRFSPPTVEQVREYCEARENNIDPEAFVDFYETNGWVQGKQGKPIKDWKACVRTWERNHVQAGRINKTTSSGSTMDQYTQALLEIDKQYGFSQGTSGIDEQ